MSTVGLDLDPRHPVGERTVLHEPIDHLEVSVERFSHSDEPRYTGMRGTILSASTGTSAYGVHMPDVFVSDIGDVSLGDTRFPAGVVLAWLRAVAEHIEERTPQTEVGS